MAEGDPLENAGPKQPHGWPKGRSGNPAGKPRGARNHATRMAERLLEGELQAVVRSVIDSAIGGDMVAAKLVLERLLPARRDRPVVLPLPPISTAGDVMLAMGAVTAAIGAGAITPTEGAAVAGVLEAQRRVIETAEIESRLAALEARQPPDEGRNP